MQEWGRPGVLGVGHVLGGEVVLGAEGVDRRAVSISGDDGRLAGREWRVDPSGEVEGPPRDRDSTTLLPNGLLSARRALQSRLPKYQSSRNTWGLHWEAPGLPGLFSAWWWGE